MRVAVVGAGSIARTIYLPILVDSDCVLDGVTSRSGESAAALARRFNIPRVYGSLDEVEADCAFVLTPKETHAEIASRLLERGLHVFLEKPMATTVADAERLVRTAERSGRILLVGFNRRYAPAYVALKEAWRDRPPDVLLAEKNRPGTEFRATLENAIHVVDLMRWVCGDAVDVVATAQYTDPHYETSCVAHVRFRHAVGVLIANRSCGQWMERIAAYGEGRSVVVDAPERVTVVTRTEERTTRLTPLAMGWSSVHDRLGFRQEVQDFLEAVRGGGQPRISPQDALETHVLMDRILGAAGLPGMAP